MSTYWKCSCTQTSFLTMFFLVAMKDGKIEQQSDASRKIKDYGSTQTGKGKGTREDFQGQQLEFLVWKLLEVSFQYLRQ